MITRIEIDGFKSFEDFSLSLPPFAVLIGANASGKSNLLEALDLLGHLVAEPTGQTLVDHARRGGPKDLFRRGPDGTPVPLMRLMTEVLTHGGGYGYCLLKIEARVHYADPPEPLTVEVTVENARRDGLDEDEESLYRAGRMPLPEAVWQEIIHDTAAWHRTRVPVRSSPYGDVLARDWRIIEPLPKPMRLMSSTYDEAPLAEDGKNLGAVLGRISRDPERWYDFVADAVALLPDLTGIFVEANSDWAQWDVWLEHKHEPRMMPSSASAGTLRVLALLAAAYDPAHPGLLMIEEPENGLFPGRVPQLLARIRGRATDPMTLRPARVRQGPADELRQFLVTSHSPVVLAAALEEAPEGVVFLDTVTRFGDGQSPRRVTRARKVSDSGERGTFVTPLEVRKYLDPVGWFARGA